MGHKSADFAQETSGGVDDLEGVSKKDSMFYIRYEVKIDFKMLQTFSDPSALLGYRSSRKSFVDSRVKVNTCCSLCSPTGLIIITVSQCYTGLHVLVRTNSIQLPNLKRCLKQM